MVEYTPNSKVLWQNFREAIGVLMHEHKRLCIMTMFFWGVRGALSLLLPILSAIVLGQLQTHINETQMPLVVVGWIVFDCFFRPTYFYSSDFIWIWNDHVELFFKNGLFKKIFDIILKTPPLVLEGQQATKVISNINSLNANLIDMMEAFFRMLGFFVPWVISGVVLLKEKPLFVAIILTFWSLSIISERYINQKFSKDGELEKWKIRNEAEKSDHIDNLVNINALNIQKEVLADMHQKLERYGQASFKITLKIQLIKYMCVFINIVPIVICYLIAAHEVLQNHELGRFVLLTGMVSEMIANGDIMVWAEGRIVRKTKAYHKLLETIAYDHQLDLKTGRERMPNGGYIELKRVTFTYPDAKEPVLKELSLKIKQGDRVAIIGNSGMGKSTLINVMQHAYEIQGGEVLINGKNVQQVTQKSLKNIITYMNQHAAFWTQKKHS